MEESPSVEIRVTIPRAWRDSLKDAASVQAVSMSDLVRLILRSFLRQQLAPADRERLQG